MDIHIIHFIQILWHSAPIFVSSILAMEAVEKGWDLMVDTTFPIICGICSIISSVFGIITVTSGSSMMNDMHFHIFVVIWVRLLTYCFVHRKFLLSPTPRFIPSKARSISRRLKMLLQFLSINYSFLWNFFYISALFSLPFCL